MPVGPEDITGILGSLQVALAPVVAVFTVLAVLMVLAPPMLLVESIPPAPPIPVVPPVVPLVALGPVVPVVFELLEALMLLEVEVLVAPPVVLFALVVAELALALLVDEALVLLLVLLGPPLLTALEVIGEVVAVVEPGVPLAEVRLLSLSGSSTTVAHPGIEPPVMGSAKSATKPAPRHEFRAFKETS